MTFKVNDRIFETSVTTGTGEYTLAGAQTGFQPFSVVGANNLVPYFATDDVNWEVGIGTYVASPSRLQRTTILASSNGGAAVNWGAGTRKIRCGLPAALAAPRMLSKSVAGGSDVTLTQDEQRREILILTGLLTANINVIVDATPWQWTVYNNTSGSFTLTVKTTAGTGQVVSQGRRAALHCDGVNVVHDISAVSDLNVGQLSIAADVALLGDIAPAQITADQNDYNPTGLSSAAVMHITSDAARNITGLAGGSDGRLIFVDNGGGFTITLKHESGSSTAANRFALPNGIDLPINPGQVVGLIYDPTTSRWNAFSATGMQSAPTVQVFTTSGTYNKPAGVFAVIIEVVGGGGGGGGQGTGTGTGTSGGTTSFGAHVSATGGGGGSHGGVGSFGGAGGAGSGGDLNVTGDDGQPGTGSATNGPPGKGGASALGGGGGNSTGTGNDYGGGGRGGGSPPATNTGGGGGGGGYARKRVLGSAVGATETVTIGSGGGGGTGTDTGKAGAGGVVIVTEFYR